MSRRTSGGDTRKGEFIAQQLGVSGLEFLPAGDIIPERLLGRFIPPDVGGVNLLVSLGMNADVESFNGRLRDELLACEIFDTLTEAKVLLEDWRIGYNWNRPHSALGNQPPAKYAATLKR